MTPVVRGLLIHLHVGSACWTGCEGLVAQVWNIRFTVELRVVSSHRVTNHFGLGLRWRWHVERSTELRRLTTKDHEPQEISSRSGPNRSPCYSWSIPYDRRHWWRFEDAVVVSGRG
jgi:hypothetical protein